MSSVRWREDGDGEKMAQWRSVKEAEWADPTSKLRAKRPTRPEFDVWLARQCHKATDRKVREIADRQRWATGFAPPDVYEWFSNCYMMRCDDDYAWGGGNLHGPYCPDATTQSNAADFLVFCVLASRRGVVPPDWDWLSFFKTASQFVCFAFEKSDAQERWGGENVFSALTGSNGGRSLRFTAEVVYGSSCQHGSTAHPDHMKANEEAGETGSGAWNSRPPVKDALYDEVGGRAAWEVFETMLGEKRSTLASHVC